MFIISRKVDLKESIFNVSIFDTQSRMRISESTTIIFPSCPSLFRASSKPYPYPLPIVSSVCAYYSSMLRQMVAILWRCIWFSAPQKPVQCSVVGYTGGGRGMGGTYNDSRSGRLLAFFPQNWPIVYHKWDI